MLDLQSQLSLANDRISQLESREISLKTQLLLSQEVGKHMVFAICIYMHFANSNLPLEIFHYLAGGEQVQYVPFHMHIVCLYVILSACLSPEVAISM